MKPRKHKPCFVWRWGWLFMRSYPQPTTVSHILIHKKCCYDSGILTGVTELWLQWQNFDCSVSLRAGACHLSGVSKALLCWHLQIWTAEKENVLKHLDNDLTDGPVLVWTSYLYITANCTNTLISRSRHFEMAPVGRKPEVLPLIIGRIMGFMISWKYFKIDNCDNSS